MVENFARELYAVRFDPGRAGEFDLQPDPRVLVMLGELNLEPWRCVAELVDNSDFRKFDGVLRMVIDGNDQQYEALSRTLAEMHAQGHLAYGLHQSPQALLTCLVHSYTGEHVHFVDGSNGGYAMAARGLKQQLASLANQSRRS